MNSNYFSYYATCPRCGDDSITTIAQPLIKDGLFAHTVSSLCGRCGWAKQSVIDNSVNEFFTDMNSAIDKASDVVKNNCVHKTKIIFQTVNGTIVEEFDNYEFEKILSIEESEWVKEEGKAVLKKPYTPKGLSQNYIEVAKDNIEQTKEKFYIPFASVETLTFSLPETYEEAKPCEAVLTITLIDNTENRYIFNSPNQLLFC